MKFLDTKAELILLPANDVKDKELEEIEASRKKIKKRIEKKNEIRDFYFTLGRNGVIPNGIRTKEKMEEFSQTLKKQKEIEEFALKFNSMTKAKRKEISYSEIIEFWNGNDYSDFYKDGVFISTVSNLTLHTISEIFEALDVNIENGKIIENSNIKIQYEPKFDGKYRIIDVTMVIFVTNKGLYELSHKWNTPYLD